MFGFLELDETGLDKPVVVEKMMLAYDHTSDVLVEYMEQLLSKGRGSGFGINVLVPGQVTKIACVFHDVIPGRHNDIQVAIEM